MGPYLAIIWVFEIGIWCLGYLVQINSHPIKNQALNIDQASWIAGTPPFHPPGRTLTKPKLSFFLVFG